MKKLLIIIGVLLSAVLYADDKTPDSQVLCIGDSLTYGEGGEGTNWPSVLASLANVKVINQGNPGWIPRHMMYFFLLNDFDQLTSDQLKAIPPSEFENRIYQPKINNLRQFIADGQTVNIQVNGQSVEYRWNANSVLEGVSAIKPNVVNNAEHRPAIQSGRWIQEGIALKTKKLPPTCVIWLGANGMDVDDLAASLKEILTCYTQNKERHFLVLGLINRQYYTSDPHDIAQWGGLIQNCNHYLQTTYPDNYIDLQAWLTSTGAYANNGYKTLEWFPQATAQQMAGDMSDQSAGIVPRTLRAPANCTHLNAMGYTIVGKLVYKFMKERAWCP